MPQTEPSTASPGTLPKDPTQPVRFYALDSLRGLAAVTVVLNHFVAFWLTGESGPSPLSPRLQAVLQPFYAGHSAVILFFILSGFVLTQPYLRHREQPYAQFLRRRIARIYLPYWAALAMAVAGAAIWHNHPYHNQWTEPMWSTPLDWRVIAAHFLLITAYHTAEYDFVVWSLVHEMRVSLFFPFLCCALLKMRWKLSVPLAALFSATVILLCTLIPHGPAFLLTAHYTMFFVLGICLAQNLNGITAWFQRQSKLRRCLFLCLSLAVYGYADAIEGWTLSGLQHIVLHLHTGFLRPDATPSVYVPLALNEWAAALGACGILLSAILFRRVRRFLEHPVPRFLGHISYSLYLIHPVILLAIGFSRWGHFALGIEFVLYVTLAIAAGWLLWLAVERPSIAFSRRL